MPLLDTLSQELEQMTQAGTLKRELPLQSPQGAVVQIEGRGDVIMLTSNNYLGLADHPAIVEAAEKAERDYGYGLASVRFICGTQTIHRELEQRIAQFLGTEDTILYGSCWNANEGLFQTIAQEQDAIISDELNHASIIDGVRLAKAKKERYANRDVNDLHAKLHVTKDARNRVVMTDGVFSMEGSLAAFDLLEKDTSFVTRLRENTQYFRAQLTQRGVKVREGIHPIVPILIGDTAKAMTMSAELLDSGVYVSGFGYPVVPQGAARLRCQISAAHTRAHLDTAIEAIDGLAEKYGVGS